MPPAKLALRGASGGFPPERLALRGASDSQIADALQREHDAVIRLTTSREQKLGSESPSRCRFRL
ncbi:MAG: hypothetical protein LBJ67_09335 [Planctomycetaceae bacterium]|nr:hypothetical protein [Planctomycetaceae bacterium]